MEPALYGSFYSEIDFKALKCSKCKKYLSVPPIFICTNLDTKNPNICGRCEVPKHSPSIRNEAFEALARCLKFPCSVSKSCPVKMTWGQSEKHELECRYRTFLCDLCGPGGVLHYVSQIKSHFKNDHPKHYISDETLIIKEEKLMPGIYSTNFVELHEKSCLVQITVQGLDIVSVNVEAVSLQIPHSFNLSFIKKDKVISFRNMLIRKKHGGNWKYYDVNIEPVRTALDILMPEDTASPFEMQLELCNDKDTNDLVPYFS